MKKILLMMLMFAPIATFAQKFGHINAQEVMTAGRIATQESGV